MPIVDQRLVDVRQYGRMLWAHKWHVAIVLICIVGAAAAWTFTRDPVYESRAAVLVAPLQNPLTTPSQDVRPLTPNLATEQRVAASAEVAAEVKAAVPDAPEIPVLLRNVSASAVPDTEVMQIGYADPDPARAAELANAFANAYLKVRTDAANDLVDRAIKTVSQQLEPLVAKLNRISARAAISEDRVLQSRADILKTRIAALQQRLVELQSASVGISGGQVIEEAEIPRSPSSPRVLTNMVLAVVIGLLIGIGSVILREAASDRIKSSRDVVEALGVPVLAIVPRWTRRVAVGLEDQNPPPQVQEAYESLRTWVQFGASRGGPTTLTVTSANEGDGKTRTVAHLAASLARAGNRVTVISGDLRRPMLDRLFHAQKGSYGLGDLLLAGEDSRVLTRSLQRTTVEALWLLPSGAPVPQPAAYLGSSAMAAILQDLEQATDFVLLDSAPILPVADTRALSFLVGGFVIVVGPTTRRRHLAALKEELDRTNTSVVGAILNGFRRSQLYLEEEATYRYEQRD